MFLNSSINVKILILNRYFDNVFVCLYLIYIIYFIIRLDVKYNDGSHQISKVDICLIELQVTKLDRDPSNGTALQEISFWLNLERALHRIQEKRESIEVALTLDILKHGKRFHATVSFDTDTGMFDCVNLFSHCIFIIVIGVKNML